MKVRLYGHIQPVMPRTSLSRSASAALAAPQVDQAAQTYTDAGRHARQAEHLKVLFEAWGSLAVK